MPAHHHHHQHTIAVTTSYTRENPMERDSSGSTAGAHPSDESSPSPLLRPLCGERSEAMQCRMERAASRRNHSPMQRVSQWDDGCSARATGHCHPPALSRFVTDERDEEGKKTQRVRVRVKAQCHLSKDQGPKHVGEQTRPRENGREIRGIEDERRLDVRETMESTVKGTCDSDPCSPLWSLTPKRATTRVSGLPEGHSSRCR